MNELNLFRVVLQQILTLPVGIDEDKDVIGTNAHDNEEAHKLKETNVLASKKRKEPKAHWDGNEDLKESHEGQEETLAVELRQELHTLILRLRLAVHQLKDEIHENRHHAPNCKHHVRHEVREHSSVSHAANGIEPPKVQPDTKFLRLLGHFLEVRSNCERNVAITKHPVLLRGLNLDAFESLQRTPKRKLGLQMLYVCHIFSGCRRVVVAPEFSARKSNCDICLIIVACAPDGGDDCLVIFIWP
mmetsp:Transcript_12091/g.24708  ORF Transcript_12091/g.24708 Transcript_12091/m.24708 type:complete len:245 (-) Transcript_12091:547-1281(-)